jgi:hypothetical protein
MATKRSKKNEEGKEPKNATTPPSTEEQQPAAEGGASGIPVIDLDKAKQEGTDPAEQPKGQKSEKQWLFIKNFNPNQPVPLENGEKVVFPNRKLYVNSEKQASHLRKIAHKYGLFEEK